MNTVCAFAVCFFSLLGSLHFYFFFFFNDTATTEIYTLSLHALFRSRTKRSRFPIRRPRFISTRSNLFVPVSLSASVPRNERDRKSTRLNSSHLVISYAVFCLKKKKTAINTLDDSQQRIVITSV